MVKWRNKFPTKVVVRATRGDSDRDDKTLFNCYARRDTWPRWREANPVLLRGEIGVVLNPTDPQVVEFIVIGDGQLPFNSLWRYR